MKRSRANEAVHDGENLNIQINPFSKSKCLMRTPGAPIPVPRRFRMLTCRDPNIQSITYVLSYQCMHVTCASPRWLSATATAVSILIADMEHQVIIRFWSFQLQQPKRLLRIERIDELVDERYGNVNLF